MSTIYFDTATTHMPDWKNKEAAWPNMVRVAMEAPEFGSVVFFVTPSDYWVFAAEAVAAHGVSREIATKSGSSLLTVLTTFFSAVARADRIVAFNAPFHLKTINEAARSIGIESPITKEMVTCAMNGSRNMVRIRDRNGNFKWPKMTEAYEHFAGRPLQRHPTDPINDGIALIEAVKLIDEGMQAAIRGAAA